MGRRDCIEGGFAVSCVSLEDAIAKNFGPSFVGGKLIRTSFTRTGGPKVDKAPFTDPLS